ASSLLTRLLNSWAVSSNNESGKPTCPNRITIFSCATAGGRIARPVNAAITSVFTHQVTHLVLLPSFGCMTRCGRLIRSPPHAVRPAASAYRDRDVFQKELFAGRDSRAGWDPYTGHGQRHLRPGQRRQHFQLVQRPQVADPEDAAFQPAQPCSQ